MGGGGKMIYFQQFKRKEIGIPLESLFLLSVGELNVNKNHEVVIKALAKLKNPNIHYAIAGTGELTNHLLKVVQDLGLNNQVHLLGYRNDIKELYSTADICVFPSVREGLGLAALEGMACGLPLICSDNKGTREYAIDGENALVCRYNSVDDFVTAIYTLSNDASMRIRMGKISMMKVGKFDINNIVLMNEKIYSQHTVTAKGFC